jgi:hypothetical protein
MNTTKSTVRARFVREYANAFAIHEGFVHGSLLRSLRGLPGIGADAAYRIRVSFTDVDACRAWLASSAHDAAWHAIYHR